MARNNRELSQLGAFISITDNSQEIDAGTFDGEVVSRHVMSIGAVDNTGFTVPPAIGIGTTNPGGKLTVVSEVDIADGNGLIVSGDVVVEQSSEHKGLVSINGDLLESIQLLFELHMEKLNLDVVRLLLEQLLMRHLL